MAKRNLSLSLALSVLILGFDARAEVTLAKTPGGFEFFTDGRLGGFAAYLQGDNPPTGYDSAGNKLYAIGDGGVLTNGAPPMAGPGQGKVNSLRFRSGFFGNILAFGVRRDLTPTVRLSGYIATWAEVESQSRRTLSFIDVGAGINKPDVREGYLRIEGPFGSLLVGKALTLFSRGGLEIDYLYGHRFGAGAPRNFETQPSTGQLVGPSGGQIGYGIVSPGFAAGIVYATPNLAGFTLTVGYYDPAELGSLYWERTKFGRPEGELTYDHNLGNLGKIHLFGNGAWQAVYANDSDRSTTLWGVGGGGRLELSIFRLGVAAFSSQGSGIEYAFAARYEQKPNNVVVELTNTQQLRKFDGLYVQSQVVLGKVDLSAGGGVTQIHEVPGDLTVDPNTNRPAISVIKQRIGINAGVVYHFYPFLHWDLDYFRAIATWWQGDKQTVNAINSGFTFTW